jgi:uncharacterized protein (TIGR03435 family)
MDDEFARMNDDLLRWQAERSRRPDVVPSNVPYVRSAKNPEAGIVSVATPEFCKHEGFTLRALLAKIWDVRESRIAFPGSIDNDARFDVVLVPPDPKSVDMEALMRDGIAAHFGLDVSFEMQSMDVLVLSAPNGIVGMAPSGGGVMSFYGTFTLDETTMPGTQEVGEDFSQLVNAASGPWIPPDVPAEISVGGTANVELVLDMLERAQDRLVVDETGANGSFDVDIRADAGVDGLIAALREQLGIVTTPSRREVRMLVVRR